MDIPFCLMIIQNERKMLTWVNGKSAGCNGHWECWMQTFLNERKWKIEQFWNQWLNETVAMRWCPLGVLLRCLCLTDPMTLPLIARKKKEDLKTRNIPGPKHVKTVRMDVNLNVCWLNSGMWQELRHVWKEMHTFDIGRYKLGLYLYCNSVVVQKQHSVGLQSMTTNKHFESKVNRSACFQFHLKVVEIRKSEGVRGSFQGWLGLCTGLKKWFPTETEFGGYHFLDTQVSLAPTHVSW